MVEKPEFWVKQFAAAGANMFTFHFEATTDPSSLIDKIHAEKMKAGISIKPGTSVDHILPYCSKLDMVLVMTVEPGFGGQKMIQSCLDKAKKLRELFHHLDIEVDGGISLENINQVAQSGANVIVAGTSIFKSANPADTILRMRSACNNHQ